jgi:hypothetical protein
LLTLFLAVAPAAMASTTWYVNGVSGSDSNTCTSPTTACKTIGHAVSLASSGDSIKVAAATYKENLTITLSLTILGSGASTTIIDGGGDNRVVTISSATAHVTLSGVTIRNGHDSHVAGGISNLGTLTLVSSTVSGNTVSLNCSRNCSAFGGGIRNLGTAIISNSTLSGNSAVARCYQNQGCYAAAYGGGILSSGTLTINNSTLSGNSADAFGGSTSVLGGGILNQGSMTVNNSTLNGNKANTGGGIANSGTARFNNSTVAGNFASLGGSGFDNGGGTVALQNSIVANNLGTGNCEHALTSNGYNLSNDGSCNFNHAGDLNNHDPLLGPLQNNGGPTETMALLPGSPAIDAGNPSGCTDGQGHLLKTDQRGMPRPDREDLVGCDMGAFERQSD